MVSVAILRPIQEASGPVQGIRGPFEAYPERAGGPCRTYPGCSEAIFGCIQGDCFGLFKRQEGHLGPMQGA